MTRSRRRLVAAGVGVVLAAGVAAGLLLTTSSASSLVPATTLPRLGGGAPVHVPATRGGKGEPTVLTFFASWCGPCYSELPVVAEVADALATSLPGVVFVGVDGNDLSSSGLSFVRRAGVHFAVGADHSSALAPRLGIPGYPATVFIDASGHVAHVVRGPVTAAVLRTWAGRIARSG